MSEVREMGGVWASLGDKNGWVRLYEQDNGVMILHDDYKKPILSPADARSLARQLYRLARRVEKRTAVGA